MFAEFKAQSGITAVRVYSDEFRGTFKRVTEYGGKVKYGTSWRCSLAIEEEHADGAPRGAAADSFNKDTKDENCLTIQEIWERLTQGLRNSRGIWQKISAIQRGEYENVPKLHRKQLAFDLGF